MSAAATDRTHSLSLAAIYDSYDLQRAGPLLVGPEFERHLLRASGEPLPYDGERGMKAALERLSGYGWELEREHGDPIAARREGETLSLEPGCQLEHALAPRATVTELARQSQAVTELLDRVAIDLSDDPQTPQFRQVALGLTPVSPARELPWAPKRRFLIMYDYLARINPTELVMMKGTCSIQCRYEYTGETDCMRKVHVAVLLAPLVAAMFANSPFYHGRPGPYHSMRGYFWSNTDPARGAFPDAALPFCFGRWIDYLLDVPMMFIRDRDGYRSADGASFRTWLVHGGLGRAPTWDDWRMHQQTVFPEVRVDTHTIELRMPDSVCHDRAMAFCALFRGLFYDPEALDRAFALARQFATHATRQVAFARGFRAGLDARHGGRAMRWWARQLVSLAADALDAHMPEDRRWLTSLERDHCPAHDLLHAWRARPEFDTITRHASFSRSR